MRSLTTRVLPALLGVALAVGLAGSAGAIPAPLRLVVFPRTAEVPHGQTQEFSAWACPIGEDGEPDFGPDGIPNGVDDFCVPGPVDWFTPEAFGTVFPTSGQTTTFTANAPDGGSTFVGAVFGPESATALVTILPGTVDAPTETTVTTEPSPSEYFQPIKLKAVVVTSVSVSGGSVAFRAGDIPIEEVPLGGDGTATAETDDLPVGTHTVTAEYSGADGVQGSSGTVEHTVEPAATTVTPAAEPSEVPAGEPVRLSGAVAGAFGGTPTGTLTFLDGDVELGSADLDGEGRASFTFTPGTAGTYTITVGYAGDGNFRPSSGQVAIVVTEPVGTFNGVFRLRLPQAPERNPAIGPGGVDLHGGGVTHMYTSPGILGRCCLYAFQLFHSTHASLRGPFGFNWDSPDNRRLVVVTDSNLDEVRASFPEAGVGDVARMDGTGRADLYRLDASGAFSAPAGFYTRLVRNADGTYVERDPHATTFLYLAPDGDGIALIASMTDRNGNAHTYERDADGQLVRIRDSLDRPIDFSHDSLGRVTDVVDFTGRSTTLRYDAAGDLAAITSPTGRESRFTYTFHQVSSVTRPNEVASGGPPALRYDYDADGRAVRVELGGVNTSGVPAGGETTLEYGEGETTVTDPNGNLSTHRFNDLGNETETHRFTNRDVRGSDPDVYVTRREFNDDGELLLLTFPAGNTVELGYDSGNPYRPAQGNLLQVVSTPDAARGGDQSQLTTAYEYEPVFNQVRKATDPRGNTTTFVFDFQEGDGAGLGTRLGVPDFEVQELLAASGTPMALGDFNGDGRTDQVGGNPVGIQRPSVRLLPACKRPSPGQGNCSPQAHAAGSTTQEIVSVYAYNDSGQMLRHRDPELNLHTFGYAGGYLRSVVVDAAAGADRNSRTGPPPAAIRTDVERDEVGNITRVVDGRGTATDFDYNAENELVLVTRASATALRAAEPAEPFPLTAFAFQERLTYDLNGWLVLRRVEDRGETSGVGEFADVALARDILGNVVARSEEVAEGTDFVTRYRYDRNGNLALSVRPEGNARSTEHDERNLVFRTTEGATSPPPGALLASGDPTSYAVRGGPSLVATYSVDANGNPVQVENAGRRTRFIYDGFDRPTSTVNAVGSQEVRQYDPAGNLLRLTRFGPNLGPSPSSDGPDPLSMPVSSGGIIQAGNLVRTTLLEATELSYDEANRPFQTDQVLFVGSVPLARPAEVRDGASGRGKFSLTPGDTQAIPGLGGKLLIRGRVTTRTDYDALGRPTFTVEDDGDLSSYRYDGAGRLVFVGDAENNTVELAYDDNGNPIERRETDVPQDDGDREQFVTSFSFDALNRLQQSVDNLGNTHEYRYDSRGNLVASSDPLGPSGPVVPRRAFGGSTATNLPGNVVLRTYDGLGRIVSEEAVLTASGRGDGSMGADVFGVKGATPVPDPAQGGGDGLATRLYEWDRNSLLERLLDDNGNADVRTYDDVNRPVAVSRTPRFFTYDDRGDLVEETDAAGSVKSYTYDGVGRLVRTDVSRGPDVGGTTRQTFQYDGLGRLTRAFDNNDPAVAGDDSDVSLFYDSLSRQIESVQRVGGSPGVAISSGWRADGLRSSLVYGNGTRVDYAYDGLDRVAEVREGDRLLSEFKYTGTSRLLERLAGNGTREGREYDGLRRVTRVVHERLGAAFVEHRYAYDRASRLLSDERAHDPANSSVHEWDSLGRLTGYDRPAAGAIPPLHRTWKLDGVGSFVEVDGVPRSYDAFDALSQLGATTVTSDANGNLTHDGATGFVYDAWNRQVGVAGGGVLVRNAFDACGNRVQRTASPAEQLVYDEPCPEVSELERRKRLRPLDYHEGDPTALVATGALGLATGDLDTAEFLVDLANAVIEAGRNARTGDAQRRELLEQRGGEQDLQFVHAGQDPLVLRIDEEPFTLHADGAGSTSALSDAAGAPVEQHLYDPFGKPAAGPSTGGNPFLFGGDYLDPGTGLYGNGPTVTSPELGRNLQRDGGFTTVGENGFSAPALPAAGGSPSAEEGKPAAPERKRAEIVAGAILEALGFNPPREGFESLAQFVTGTAFFLQAQVRTNIHFEPSAGVSGTLLNLRLAGMLGFGPASEERVFLGSVRSPSLKMDAWPDPGPDPFSTDLPEVYSEGDVIERPPSSFVPATAPAASPGGTSSWAPFPSGHAGGATFLFGDGCVRNVRPSISPDTSNQLVGPSLGQVIGSGW